MQMPIHSTRADIAIRRAVIGFNRETRGHAAGLRRTILVGLAVALSMRQANVLLTVGGETADSFGIMDRLPLGILTGVGVHRCRRYLAARRFDNGCYNCCDIMDYDCHRIVPWGRSVGLGLCATILAVITLWTLLSLDVRIPRKDDGG